jgi:heptosyltransferase-2
MHREPPDIPAGGTVAVFLPSPLGDVVMATPSLRALREKWPEARIFHVGRQPALDVLSGTGLADETVLDDTKARSRLGPVGRLGRLVRAGWRLRARRIDLAVLLPNSFRPAAMAWIGGARQRAGYVRNGRGWLLSHRRRPPRDATGRRVPVPTIVYYADLVKQLGAAAPAGPMELGVEPRDQDAADALLRRAGIDPHDPGLLVTLNPGAAFGPSKLWPADRYARLAELLRERHDARIIVNAAPDEQAVALAVEDAMTRPPELSFARRSNTIGLLKGLIRRSTLLVTNDTGPRHVAAAMGVGLVTIFGSTDPVWARIDYPRERIVRVEVPCGPCQQKTCPLPEGEPYHQCMTRIQPEQVLQAVESLLPLLRPAQASGS